MAKLSWGLIGGGRGSQIGPAHRIAASLDGEFSFDAAALDADSEQGKTFAIELGVSADRAYGDWAQLVKSEASRPDRADLVTIATPNSTHFEIAKALLEHGFNVLCEKPMTMTVDEARHISELVTQTGAVFAVNFGYSGYPMVRQMRAMIAAGELGRIRLVKSVHAHGFHADAADLDNPRVRWRYEPEKVGRSAQFADCGVHALHLATFVTGQQPVKLSAHFETCLEGRALEDDAAVNLRLQDGALCRLWTSAVAIGRMHGLEIQVFGEKGGLRWAQEWPNQLFFTPLSGRTQIIERGADDNSSEALQGSRLTIGHAEGMLSSFANIYADLAQAIQVRKTGQVAIQHTSLLPDVRDGLISMMVVQAAVRSASNNGAWEQIEI